MNGVCWNFVKPFSVKLAMSHLQNSKAAPWNHALQTLVLLWIGSKVLCIRTNTHSYDMLQSPFTWPSFTVPSVPIVRNVCLQGTWFYTILYGRCNAWYMILMPWVDLIHCSLNQSEHLPTSPFDWGKLVYSVANQSPGLMRHAPLK